MMQTTFYRLEGLNYDCLAPSFHYFVCALFGTLLFHEAWTQNWTQCSSNSQESQTGSHKNLRALVCNLAMVLCPVFVAPAVLGSNQNWFPFTAHPTLMLLFILAHVQELASAA